MKKYTTPPFYLLKKFLNAIPKGNAIDIGTGNGHNSIFLAQNGFAVEAIDTDSSKIKALNDIAEKSELKIDAKNIDVRKFDFSKKQYNLVLAMQSLVFIKKSEFQEVINNIKKALNSNGVIILISFTTDDASFKRLKQTSPEVEKNTFQTNDTKQYWQFFEKDELKKYFKEDNFDILFYEEQATQDEPHEGSPSPHIHGIAKIVARKKAR